MIDKAKLSVKTGRKTAGLLDEIAELLKLIFEYIHTIGGLYMARNDTMHATMTHPPRKKPIRNKSNKFSQQEVNLASTPLFFPEGFEKFFIAIYFITLPYIAGLLFLFFYVAESKKEIFLSLNEESSFILTWAIGYEIIATLILLYIVKMAITFTNNNRKSGVREFRRP